MYLVMLRPGSAGIPAGALVFADAAVVWKGSRRQGCRRSQASQARHAALNTSWLSDTRTTGSKPSDARRSGEHPAHRITGPRREYRGKTGRHRAAAESPCLPRVQALFPW